MKNIFKKQLRPGALVEGGAGRLSYSAVAFKVNCETIIIIGKIGWFVNYGRFCFNKHQGYLYSTGGFDFNYSSGSLAWYGFSTSFSMSRVGHLAITNCLRQREILLASVPSLRANFFNLTFDCGGTVSKEKAKTLAPWVRLRFHSIILKAR